MKKLQVGSKNEIVEYEPNGSCHWCKISGLDVFYQRGSGSSAVCRNCASELVRLFRTEAKLPNQVSLSEPIQEAEEF